jgi:signal transduction histidine kinase
LAAVLAAVGAAGDPEAALRALLEGALAVLDGDSAVARLFESGTQRCVLHLRLKRGGQVERDPGSGDARPGSYTDRLLQGGSPALVDDYATVDPEEFAYGPRMVARGYRSALHAPIEAGGRRIGTLSLNHGQPGFFEARDLNLATAAAGHAGAAVERAWVETRRQDTVRRQAARLEAVNEFARVVGSTLDLDAVCRLAVERVAALTGAARCVVLQHVPDAGDGTDRFRFRAAWHRGADLTPSAAPFAGRVAGTVFQTQSPLIVRDTRTSESDAMRDRAGDGILSVIAVPIAAAGAPWGVLNAGYPEPNAGVTEIDEQTEFLTATAAHLGVAVQNAELFAQLHAARAAAEAAVREREEFLSVAAHELKTPITSLRGAAQLALRRLARGAAVDPQQMGRTLELVDRQANRLTHLVNHLLDVARIEAGKLILAPEPTDLGQLVADIVPLVPADAAYHPIEVRSPGTPIVAVVDSLRLEQVLLNLLTNAVKYSPEGGEIAVELTRPDPGTVRLAVRDHGLGVPPERREHLFERFYQAHGEGHLSGLGLGLYVSRQIVDLHGGTIAAEFPADGGTRIVVTLPAGIDPAVPDAPSPSAQTVTATVAHRREVA